MITVVVVTGTEKGAVEAILAVLVLALAESCGA